MASLLCMGDSHLQALEFAANLKLLLADEIAFRIVPGATAVGLRNPNSSTNALKIFLEAATNAPRSTFIILHLGEVDCGFVMWWRAEKFGETIESQMASSIAAYENFVLELIGLRFTSICITGATIPTLRDGIDFGDVANKRSEIKTSLLQRTALTRAYNGELEKMAARLDLPFVDLSVALIDRETEVVCDYFRSPCASDHHLDETKIAGLWSFAVNNFVLKALSTITRDEQDS